MTFEKVILELGGNPSRLTTAISLLQANPGSHLVISSESPASTVLAMLFDTHDAPKVKQNFNETLKITKLRDILSEKSL
jgi:hypothetical protein